jgi:hypothetical protein
LEFSLLGFTNRDFVHFFLFLILVSTIAGFCDFKNSSDLTTPLSNLGSWFSGLGTLIAALYALIKVPEGFRTYKRRKYTEKQMEVAISLLDSVAKFVSAMSFLSNPFSFGGEVSEDKKKEQDYDYFRELVNNRFKTIEEDVKDFYKYKRQAEVFLGQEKGIQELLEGIQKQWSELTVAMRMYGSASDSERRHHFYEDQYKIFYDTDNKRRDELDKLKIRLIETIDKFSNS